MGVRYIHLFAKITEDKDVPKAGLARLATFFETRQIGYRGLSQAGTKLSMNFG